MEVACSPHSTMSAVFQENGFTAKRINYLTGYDLDTKKGMDKLAGTISGESPRFVWVSMKCTRLSGLQNLTPRDAEQMDNFLRRRGQDLRRCEDLAGALEPTIQYGNDFAWEWPTTATAGWRSRAITKLQRLAKKYGRHIYWITIDGCMYGLEWKSQKVKKSWTIMTTSRELWLTLNKKCDWTHEHVHCRGVVAQASAYYPGKMCQDVVKAMKHCWQGQQGSMEDAVETYLLNQENTEMEKTGSGDLHHGLPHHGCQHHRPHAEVPEQVLALSRRRLDLQEAPTGKKLEAVKQLMLRVHRASGHSGMSNLVQLLRAKGAPGWALKIAEKLECPECKESSRPRPRPPASAGDEAKIYEILGTDVFEFEDEKQNKKYKMILWRDRGSGLTMIDHLQTYAEGAWEPTSSHIIKSFNKWVMTYPTPKWVLGDSARYYVSQEFQDHLQRSGVGLSIAPAEAHWIMSHEEGAIGIAKRTVERLVREGSKLEVPELFTLAAGAMNSHVNKSGFSPFQWVFGSGGGVLDDEQLPRGIDASKAFGGLVKNREKAMLAFEKERAGERFSKLANSIGRSVTSYKPGQLVMLWRQRVKPGKIKGGWTGPVRLILLEGSTAWLTSGATLIRAKLNQIRPTGQREDLDAMLEGTSVHKTPVTVERLMQSFQGRFYLDVAADVPSEAQQREDLSPAEVLQEPAQPQRADTWSVEQNGPQRILIRHHNLPRLALFHPEKAGNCPVLMDDLTGKRTTIVKPMTGDGAPATIVDTIDVQRNFLDRWTGETRFELKEEAPAPKRLKKKDKGEKRKAEDQLPRDPQDQPPGEDQPADLPQEPGEGLQRALRERGPEALDGRPAIQGAAGSNDCAVSECVLPGGHDGHHRDQADEPFMYDPYEGRRGVVENQEEPINQESDTSSSSSSTSSEELLPDDPEEADEEEKPKETFMVVELNLNEKDIKYLESHRKAKYLDIWLSKKMAQRGGEVTWSKLDLDQKKEFDMGMAKEVSNVVISKALRSLTDEERQKLDPKKVMAMRWVLTYKPQGDNHIAKARLVVLGFQAHNLTTVQTSSPTLSKLGRNCVLMIAAAKSFKIKSGDVTAAFLQTGISLEDEELNVLAPPELSAMYGGQDGEQVVLRIREAFYGLAHAPRKWYERCVKTMTELGWIQLKGDKCVFVLFEVNEQGHRNLCGVAGLHVDDFLIAGSENSKTYKESEDALLKKFRWGKWETTDFEFAGCTVKQMPNNDIYLHQESYTMKWVEEMEIDPTRPRKALLTPSEITMLRGSLGTISWKATQTGPQYLAEVSLLLSEISKGTVETLYKVNKLAREIRREAAQRLLFPSWNCEVDELAVVTYADASQHNRPDGSSTIGIITVAGPKAILEGQETQMAILQWKSGKTPRQCLGSNGAEVQSITIGEDMNFCIRMFLAEMTKADINRDNVHEIVKEIPGALVMDSRGIYDAATRNLSALHGLRDSRAGYELVLAVNNSLRAETQLRWVNGLAQLGDSLTKSNARKVLLQFFSQKQFWKLIHDEKFEAGKKVHKRELEKRVKAMQSLFVQKIKEMAEKHHWPWDEGPMTKYSHLD